MKSVSSRVILGIDPGTTVMGYGLIAINGSVMELLDTGALHLAQEKDHALKLKKIFEHTLQLIDRHHPDDLAIEAPFYGKNVQSMLKLGRAQGVAMAAGLFRTLPIFEYSPKKVKQSITGNGNASKEQVASMLKTLLRIKDLPDQLDATDGLAVAVCHFFQKGNSSQLRKGSKGGWGSFVAAHPTRVVTS